MVTEVRAITPLFWYDFLRSDVRFSKIDHIPDTVPKPMLRGLSAVSAGAGIGTGVGAGVSARPSKALPFGMIPPTERRWLPEQAANDPGIEGPGYETALHTVAVPGATEIVIRSLLDRRQYHDPDGEAQRLGISPAFWPLFGLLWPSSVRMATQLAQRPVRPTEKILEIGCGLALPSLVAHDRGADVTASDRHPLAPVFLQENLRLNRLPSSLKYRHGQWGGDEPAIRAPGHYEVLTDRFDLIIGSDLLYERDVAPVLARFIDQHARPAAEVWIVDANRGYRPLFSRCMLAYGFDVIESVNLTQDNDHHQPSAYRGKLLKYRR